MSLHHVSLREKIDSIVFFKISMVLSLSHVCESLSLSLSFFHIEEGRFNWPGEAALQANSRQVPVKVAIHYGSPSNM